MDERPGAALRLASPAGRWTVAAAVLGSATVFLESTVVSVALPAIGRDLGLGVAGLQWVVNGYLITLSSLLLLGGALGDAWGQKRVFELGLVAFAAASLVTAIAPTFPLLIGARLVQGAAGALLVPTSLAFIDTSFVESDRAEAIGAWAGWSAVSTALGPVLGGLVIDNVSWRWIFASIAPFALLAFWIARARVPAAPAGTRRGIDVVGAALASASLGLVVWSLIEGSAAGVRPAVAVAGAIGVVLGGAFVLHEARTAEPLLPLALFRSRQFSGANATTLLVYAAVGALFFFLMVQLQAVLGYSAVAAGASLLPFNLLMLALSARSGRWAERHGPRLPLAAGCAVAAAGFALLARVAPGSSFMRDLLPGVAVLGVGFGLLVAPLTASVLAAAADDRTGIASGVNNATARLAGLLAVALIPVLVGVAGLEDYGGATFAEGYRRAMWISAGLCAGGAAIAWSTVREAAKIPSTAHPSPTHGCARHSA